MALQSERQIFEALAQFLPVSMSYAPFSGTRRAKRSGVFLCIVSLDIQRNDGAGQGNNPTNLILFRKR